MVATKAENLVVPCEDEKRRKNAALIRIGTNGIEAEKIRDRPVEDMDGSRIGWRSAGDSQGGTGNLPLIGRIAAVTDIIAMQPTTEDIATTTTLRFTTAEAGRIAATLPPIAHTAVLALPGTATGGMGIPASPPAGMVAATRTVRGTLDDMNEVTGPHKPRRVMVKVDGRR